MKISSKIIYIIYLKLNGIIIYFNQLLSVSYSILHFLEIIRNRFKNYVFKEEIKQITKYN